MTAMPGMATPAAVAALEADVRRALETGDQSGVRVLGYGEISVVLALDCDGGAVAAKRLPEFPDDAAFDAYRATFADYVATLGAAGVEVVPSELVRVPDDPRVIAYCVQPLLEPDALGPAVARADRAEDFLRVVIEKTAAAIGPRLGLDAQISNWAEVDGRVVQLDVTTPMLRDESGAEQADLDLFLASLPAALRPVVRRFLLDDILATYYDRRAAIGDLAANLVKERLDDLVPTAVAIANDHVDPPLTAEEVRSHYRSDARMWALLQRLRRLDRGWQRRVRRRPYQFLLPPTIER